MAIRAVFFDFGGVLYRSPDPKWLRRWMKWLRLGDDPDVTGMIFAQDDSPYFQAVMEGRVTESEVWARLAARSWVKPLILEWLRGHAFSRRQLNREVVAYLGKLRPRYRTGILSNIGSDGRQLFSRVFGFDRLVDTMILSAEEGMMKPDERLYQVALQRLGVSAPEAVFLDDKDINVAAAQRVGMHAVYFRDTRQALAEVDSLLKWHND